MISTASPGSPRSRAATRSARYEVPTFTIDSVYQRWSTRSKRGLIGREHAPELGVAGRRVDDLVHRVDAGQRLDQLTGGGVRGRALERAAHGAHAGGVEARHAELVGAHHQHLHDAQDVERRLARERCDAVRAARQLLDEAVGDEALDRLAHGHRAEAERLGQGVDHERIARRQPARDDGLAQAEEGLVAQVAGVDGGEGRHVEISGGIR